MEPFIREMDLKELKESQYTVHVLRDLRELGVTTGSRISPFPSRGLPCFDFPRRNDSSIIDTIPSVVSNQLNRESLTTMLVFCKDCELGTDDLFPKINTPPKY